MNRRLNHLKVQPFHSQTALLLVDDLVGLNVEVHHKYNYPETRDLQICLIFVSEGNGKQLVDALFLR
jgi:hypothetical protein